MVLMLTGCSTVLGAIGEVAEEMGGSKTQSFTKAGMTIDLNENFKEESIVNFTGYYVSTDIIVVTLKENYSLFEGTQYGPNTSLKEYAELVIHANGFENKEVIEEDGLTGFRYEKEINGKDLSYFAYVYKCDDAFWLVQFAVEKEYAEEKKDEIVDFAKSVRFEKE